MSSGESSGAKSIERGHFATTQWSVVLAAGNTDPVESRAALAKLCETYWFPLYAYVRRRVASSHEAQDLTQAFLTQLLEREGLTKAQPDRGRFRAYLLTACKNFLNNEWNKARAEKRGGGATELSLDFAAGESRYGLEPRDELTPERLFERQWVTTLLGQVLDVLRLELASAGKEGHFTHLKLALTGEATAEHYESAAAALGLTPAAAKQAAYRLRNRYRELLRAEVARTVSSESEIDEEIRGLFEILGTTTK